MASNRPRRDWTRTQRAQSTRATQQQNGYGPVPVILRPRAVWRQQQDLTVRLTGLDQTTTTLTLWKVFSREGDIIFIDLYENPDGTRSGSGRIRFAPPPKEDFWNRKQGLYQITRENGAFYNIRVKLVEYRPEPKFQSPVRKHIFYQPLMQLKPEQLDFGMIEEEHTIMSLRRVKPIRDRRDLSFEVDLKRAKIVVKFAYSFIDPRSQGVSDFISSVGIGKNDRDNHYMFQIPFGQLQTIKYIDFERYKISDYFGLVISLDSPPRFFRKQLGNTAGHAPGGLRWSEFDTWYRQTDVDYDPLRLATAKVSLHKNKPEIDIGRWTTYLLTFRKSSTNSQLYEEMKQALQDFNVAIVEAEEFINWEPSPAELWDLIDPPTATGTAAELAVLDTEGISYSLPFETRYQLEVCISRGYLSEYNITRDFLKALSELSYADQSKARNLLEYVAEQAMRIFDPMSIFQNVDALAYSPRTEKIPHYCAHVRKATITPTTIYYSTPSLETTNRVLRHYARENQDGRFLRVQFTDEAFEGRINSTKKTSNDELFTRVYRTLYNGIQIGDRHYEFLAFGNSQFREHGAYFFCRTADLSCDDIRAWMGNFSHINVVAKYAARLGQCFSTTRAIDGLSNPTLVKIEDVERNGYCFTDGVGKISSFMAKMIVTDLGIQGTTEPSAFQFRLGGCKGVLAVWPDAKEKEVHIRPSQQKFAATYNGLEIIKCSQYSCATLNRQTITILSSLGVPDQVFLEMLIKQLSNYEAAMHDDNLAVSLLCRYIDDTQMTINIATMIRNGFMAQRDPFVISLLHLWRAWSIKLLKEKAKIIVEDGAFVLGCVDETGTLRGYPKPTSAGDEEVAPEELPQIFIQIPTKSDPNKYEVIKGTCLVGRNPSLHPGDLRVVQAVDVPALHHLRDVVVFPLTGERDIPSMCSGGDLDGDDFFVLWDKGLLPKERNCEPMSNATPSPKISRRPVKITDLMKFFVVYMKNDTLPTIAHAHLAQADFLNDNVKDPRCLELAHLHSKAVDYVKSGQPAEMPKRLAPQKWPHYMEKKHKPKDQQYISPRVLGQLYDRVESVSFIPQWQERFDPRILRRYKLEDSLLKTVRQIKSKYDTAMRRILANQDISNEFEVWTTFILTKRRIGSEYKIQEEISRYSDSLKDQFRTICIEAAGGTDFEKLGPFVAGMYKVTKEELDIALAECRTMKIVSGRTIPKRQMVPKSMPLISFPWLFAQELGRIATGVDTNATVEDLGLLSLGYKLDGTARRRQGGGGMDIDDFVQQENGVIVHRGEELDLFRPDPDDISEHSFAGEQRSSDDQSDSGDYDGSAFGSGTNVLIDAFNLTGTGVEDIVAPPALEGLIDPEEAARRLHDSKAFLSHLELKKALPPGQLIDLSMEETLQDSMSESLSDFRDDLSQLDSGPQINEHQVGHESSAELLTQDEETLEISEKNNDPTRQEKSLHDGVTRSISTGSVLESTKSDDYEEIEEVEELEEIIDLPTEESAIDRLLRMHRT